MTPQDRLLVSAHRLAKNEAGGATLWMTFWMIAFMMIGGVAVDTAKAWRMEVMLRATADAAAHAAVIDLVTEGETAARETALAFAADMLPAADFGAVLAPEDIEFGRWDPEIRVFSAAESPDSVRVTLRRGGANGNGEPTTLLRLVGQTEWDIFVTSVARIVSGPPAPPDTDPCWLSGLVSRQVVRARSNNLFSDVCIHGELGVSFRNNNEFGGETLVTMPTLDLLDLPGSGFTRNVGLADRLAVDSNDPWIVDHIDDMIQEMRVDANAVEAPASSFDPSTLAQGVTYWFECASDGVLTIPQNAVLDGLVILTNCAIEFRKDVVLIDTTIGTTGDRAGAGHTVHTPSGLNIGAPDGCTPGGGSRLLIDGTFHSAAKLRMNGSQIIASGAVKLAAQARGLDGFSVLSGEDIDVTSNNGFGGCRQVDFSIQPPRDTWRSRPAAFALAR